MTCRRTPGVAAGQAGHLERQHEPDDRRRERLPHADRVGEDQVALQQLELVGRDVGRGEAAEAGVDAVGRLAAGHDGGDGRGAGVDGGVGGGVEVERLAAAGDAAEVRQGQVAWAQEHGAEAGTTKLSRQVPGPGGGRAGAPWQVRGALRRGKLSTLRPVGRPERRADGGGQGGGAVRWSFDQVAEKVAGLVLALFGLVLAAFPLLVVIAAARGRAVGAKDLAFGGGGALIGSFLCLLAYRLLTGRGARIGGGILSPTGYQLLGVAFAALGLLLAWGGAGRGAAVAFPPLLSAWALAGGCFLAARHRRQRARLDALDGSRGSRPR